MQPRDQKSKIQSHRRFNPDELKAQWKGLREDFKIFLESKIAKVEEVKGDTTKFFKEICHLQPYAYQLELAELYRQNQFLAVRWPIRKPARAPPSAGYFCRMRMRTLT